MIMASTPPGGQLATFARGETSLVEGGRWRQPQESWQRCVASYGLDPESTQSVNVVTKPELARRQHGMSMVLEVIWPELEALYSAISGSGYSLGFVDPDGVTIRYWDGDSGRDLPAMLGTVWKEDQQGTNSAGTCLIEKQPIAFHRNDHFLRSWKNISCASAPVFDWNHNLLGALDVTAPSQAVLEEVHRTIFDLVQAAARRMEDRLFNACFSETSVISIYGRNGIRAMLALSEDETIVGLNRVASHALTRNVIGRKMWEFFDRPSVVKDGYVDDRFSVELKLVDGRAVIPSNLRGPLGRIWQLRSKEGSKNPSPRTPSRSDLLERCCGSDRSFRAQIEMIRRVQDSRLPILILGETGVGKDVLAQAVHATGRRAKQPYVAFNCSAVPEPLIDSELFGYAPGAFTGARKDGHNGLVASAHGGTLFLDEIGDMPLTLQSRLLRMLESGEVMPLGSGKVRRVDVSIIAATNVDLNKKVAEGTFRSDLFYRLAGLVINVPALRHRQDFETIANNVVLDNTAGRETTISPEAMRLLKTHHWPGNIRELRNVLVRGAYLAPGRLIRPEDIFITPVLQTAPAIPASSKDIQPETLQAEKILIDQSLQQFDGDVTLAAKHLGISRATLYRKLKRIGGI